MPPSLRVAPVAFLSLAATPLNAQVVTAQYDNARTGANIVETTLTPRTVSPATFGKTAVLKVDGDVYAQVLHLPSVAMPGKGTHASIFVATEHNSVYAFEATDGGLLWRVSLSDGSTGAIP